MYNAEGNFNPNIPTKTADEFLAAIKNKEITLEFDTRAPTINRKLAEGAIQRAFTKFLQLRKDQEKPPLKQQGPR